jgi:hypothetical protein
MMRNRMRYVTGLVLLGFLLALSHQANAIPYQVPGAFTDIGPGMSIVVVDDPGDTNDAYGAVREWGEKYALTSLQGTHSNVKTEAWYQWGFKVQGASSVDVEINYTLMAEAFSLHQAFSQAWAVIGIYRYEEFQGTARLSNGMPIWTDQISLTIGPETLDQPYYLSDSKVGATDTLTLSPRWDWGENWYMVEVFTRTRGQDTYQIQYQPGTYENPDAWYSSAAYADPTFTVLTPGASLTEFSVTSGWDSASGGELDPPPTLPEPSTALLLATGLAGLAAAGRRRSLQ